MRFYRSINTIKALTFDLDDTLYDNVPVMKKAEDAFMQALNQFDGLHDITLTAFNALKKIVLTQDADIYHDVVAWRKATILYLLQQKGLTERQQINHIIDETMAQFVYWRHQIKVPQTSLDLLSNLAEKYPLAVITNGNVEIDKIGLADYFQFALRGGVDGRSKPFPEIFNSAAEQLGVVKGNILHVGDCLHADIAGAINSGMQACWINTFNENIFELPKARLLPHVEISHLYQINDLL